MRTNRSIGEQLCLRCGLCCNGVLFKDVELQVRDDLRQLVSSGLTVRPARSESARQKLPQPCAALCTDNRCRIYADRPTRCREFECLQLRDVQAGKIDSAAALRTIERAHQSAERVRILLRWLGEGNEDLALSLRFNRLKRRLERDCCDEETAEQFAQLTLAVHELNLLLSTKFYPEPGV